MSPAEIVDLEPGLWIWRTEHPHWSRGDDWPPVVTSVCVDAGDERWLIDPLLPSRRDSAFWDRLHAHPPTAVATLLPDHLRETRDDPDAWSIDVLAAEFGCRAFGPNAFDDDMAGPTTPVERIEPGRELPGGLVPFASPRGNAETPVWLPLHRTLVVGDTLTERDGELRVWTSPTHEEAAVPALERILELPLERVIVSHGSPVHSRAELQAALTRPPWPASSLHIAAWRGDLAQVRRLVEAGADLDARSEAEPEGTPLDWAMQAAERADDPAPQTAVAEYLRAQYPSAEHPTSER